VSIRARKDVVNRVLIPVIKMTIFRIWHH